jgi:hypothetical protein
VKGLPAIGQFKEAGSFRLSANTALVGRHGICHHFSCVLLSFFHSSLFVCTTSQLLLATALDPMLMRLDSGRVLLLGAARLARFLHAAFANWSHSRVCAQASFVDPLTHPAGTPAFHHTRSQWTWASVGRPGAWQAFGWVCCCACEHAAAKQPTQAWDELSGR